MDVIGVPPLWVIWKPSPPSSSGSRELGEPRPPLSAQPMQLPSMGQFLAPGSRGGNGLLRRCRYTAHQGKWVLNITPNTPSHSHLPSHFLFPIASLLLFAVHCGRLFSYRRFNSIRSYVSLSLLTFLLALPNCFDLLSSPFPSLSSMIGQAEDAYP